MTIIIVLSDVVKTADSIEQTTVEGRVLHQ